MGTVGPVTARAFPRAAAGLAVALLIVMSAASPAVALVRDDGDDPGRGLSLWATLGWFVGLPVAACLVIALLVLGPGSARGPRYRPGVGWWAAPVWFNGPDRATAGRSGATATDLAGAAATDPAAPGAVVPAATTMNAGGGASARW
jgi:hypothetical protein